MTRQLRTRWVLLLSLAVTAVLYAVPQGRFVVYPCVLLSTLAHEMGHGVAALFVGGAFQKLQMWPDGSGMATVNVQADSLGRALVSAGGLVGPAVVAALAFVLGRTEKGARVCLWTLAFLLLVAEVLVVRNFFGWFFVALVAVVCLLAARRKSGDLAQWVMVFLAVQLGLSVFSRSDYLFTDVAMTAAGAMPSDVAQMDAALPFPYWFWGGVCGAFSVLVLAMGVLVFWGDSAGESRTARPGGNFS